MLIIDIHNHTTTIAQAASLGACPAVCWYADTYLWVASSPFIVATVQRRMHKSKFCASLLVLHQQLSSSCLCWQQSSFPALAVLDPTGGPAGLASAIMFAKRGCKVTVAERNSEVTYSDPDRSYVYAIDGRGRQFTDKYDITQKLADASVDALDVSVTRVFPSGKSVTRRQVIKDEKRLVYWLPRSK